MTLRQAQGERTLPYMQERWFKLLQEAIAQSSITAVAAKLGYGRSRISQVMNGLMLNAKPDKIAARVLDVLDRWECPYLNTEIVAAECRSIHAGDTPSHNPALLAHRRVCRTCAHNNKHPQGEKP
jgi:hypothetical protein